MYVSAENPYVGLYVAISDQVVGPIARLIWNPMVKRIDGEISAGICQEVWVRVGVATNRSARNGIARFFHGH